ncbi:MAG: GTP 3',8-cyclase MoaA [Elusimicrobiota bacterium]
MLIDTFNRKIDYLRISVTDRCNLRCVYCLPEAGIIHKEQNTLLSFEEIVRVVEAAVKLGVDKVRLTGGEPLVRKGIVSLVGMLAAIPGISDLSMTTNGILLPEFARRLKDAGLKRLNISLDSLTPDRYRRITRRENLAAVEEGIRFALRLGFNPLKINVLLLSDLDNQEIVKFLQLTRESNLHLRFLEFMPINAFYQLSKPIAASTVLELAGQLGTIEETKIYGHGPAKNYQLKGFSGTFGIIEPMSNKFCSSCNRLRLTADGFLKSCLHSNCQVNLRDRLRRDCAENGLVQLIKTAVKMKPKEHSLDRLTRETSEHLMCQIGG